MEGEEATKALRILECDANFIVAVSPSEVINLEAAWCICREPSQPQSQSRIGAGDVEKERVEDRAARE